MNNNIIGCIRKAFLSFFDNSYEQEIEKLFDELIIRLWELKDNQIKIVSESKTTSLY